MQLPTSAGYIELQPVSKSLMHTCSAAAGLSKAVCAATSPVNLPSPGSSGGVDLLSAFDYDEHGIDIPMFPNELGSFAPDLSPHSSIMAAHALAEPLLALELQQGHMDEAAAAAHTASSTRHAAGKAHVQPQRALPVTQVAPAPKRFHACLNAELTDELGRCVS